MSLARCATASRTSSLTRTTGSPVTGARRGADIGSPSLQANLHLLAARRLGCFLFAFLPFAGLLVTTFAPERGGRDGLRPTVSASKAAGHTSLTLHDEHSGFRA